MFTTPEYLLTVEADYRRARLAHDWSQANRRRRGPARRRFLWLPKRPTLKLPQQQSGGVAVA